MGNLLRASNDPDLIDSPDLGTQAAVDAEKLAIDDGSENKEIEDVAARLPYGSVAVLLLTFFVESVHLCDLAGFVVPSDENNAIWVSIWRQYAVYEQKETISPRGRDLSKPGIPSQAAPR